MGFVGLGVLIACAGEGPASSSSRHTPSFAYSAAWYCANGWIEYCAGSDTVPSHAIVGSTWDRLHEAAFLINTLQPECEEIQTLALGMMQVPDQVRGYTGTQQFLPEDPEYPRSGLAFNVGGVVRYSDQMYMPGSQYADSLQRVVIHEMAHILWGVDEVEADEWEVACEGDDGWKLFGLPWMLAARSEQGV